MASAVTTPLERQFGQMPSLTQMTSVSSFGYSQITLQFDLDRNIDAAAAGRAGGDQRGVEPAAAHAADAADLLARATRPTRRSSRWRSARTTLPLDQVDDYADSILAQKISQVSGVGLVTLNGGQKPAVRVQVDPGRARRHGPDARGRAHGARRGQRQPAQGQPRRRRARTTRSPTNDQLYKAGGFKPLVIAYENGVAGPPRATSPSVVDGVENAQLAGWANDKRAIILNVQRQPGANVIQVADRVKALLPQLAGVAAAGRSTSRSWPTAPRRCAPRSTTSSSRWSSPSAWSSRSSSSSCATCGRRSSRASRCRCRSSARSA